MNLAPVELPVRPLRVLMISDVYFPRINGVSTSIETFRRDLDAQGVETVLVAPDYPGADGDVHRIPARRLPFDPEDRLMRWGLLSRKAHELAGQGFDLIHVQTPFAAHYAGLRAARCHGMPVISTWHTHFEEYFHLYLPLLPRFVLRGLARRITRGQCNALDAVVVPSQAMRDTLNDYGIEVPLHIVPTGIPIAQFDHGDGMRFRHRHGIAEDRPVALYVGRVAHEKNIDFLIEVTACLRDVMPQFLLVIAGEGPALHTLRHQVERLGVESNVLFVGYLDRTAELPDCYAAADVFAFSSKTETQGLVLLEAMAAGLPVCALAEMGTHDILDPQRGAVIAPDDTEKFAEELAALLRDVPRRERLALDARDYARKWSAPERAAQMAALYRLVAGSGRRSAAHTS